MITNAFSISAQDCVKQLQTRKEGLAAQEAEQRLQKYGQNKLREGKKINPTWKTRWSLILKNWSCPFWKD